MVPLCDVNLFRARNQSASEWEIPPLTVCDHNSTAKKGMDIKRMEKGIIVFNFVE